MIKLFTVYKTWSLEKKIAGVGLSLILFFLLGLFVSKQIGNRQLANNGRYFIAEIVKIGRAKNGAHYYIQYQYKGEVYKGSFKPDFGFVPNKVGAYIFIRFLPSNPEVYRYLDLGEVPDCLRLRLPKEGWSNIPNCD